jgi:hypothetical protein
MTLATARARFMCLVLLAAVTMAMLLASPVAAGVCGPSCTTGV